MFIKLLLNKNLIINSQNRPKSWAQLLSKKMMEFKLGGKVKHTYGLYQFTHKILWIIIPPNI